MLPPVAALPEEEIAHFASGLDEQQRTYLNRLLGECLSSLGDDAYTAGAVGPEERLRLVQSHLEPLKRMLACLRQFRVAEDGTDIRPFSVQMPDPGHALVTLSVRLAGWRGIWDTASHDWVDQLRPGRVSVDVSRLGDLPSAVIAWLVTLANRLPSRRLALIGASQRTVQALKVLRFDHILTVGAQPGTMTQR